MRGIRILLPACTALAVMGGGSGWAETFAEWQRGLAEHIRCHLVYPSGLGRPTSPRTARVVFEIDAAGHLGNINIEQSSGVMVFDRAALAAVTSASPAPSPPGLPDGRPLTVHIPLTFFPPHDGSGAPEAPRSESPNKEPPVCRDIGIM